MDENKYNLNVEFLIGIKDEEHKDNIVKFINEYNKTISGNITLIDKELINKFSNIGAYFNNMMKNNKIIGIIILIPLTICKNKENINKSGLSTFFCIHPSLRKLGLGSNMIKNSIKIGIDNNINTCYYIGPIKKYQNSLSLTDWYRPININILNKSGFTLPFIKDTIKDKIKYKPSWDKKYIINKINNDNIIESLNYYLKEINNLKISYYPDLDEWIKWINNFRTYIVINKENIILGLFSMFDFNALINNIKIKITSPILYCGNTITMKALIYENKNYDLIYGYIYNNITSEIIKNNKGIISNNKNKWLSFYNYEMLINENEICIPLL